MKITATIIGMGIGQKHFDAIESYKNLIIEKPMCLNEFQLKKIYQLLKKKKKIKIKYLTK